MNLRHFRYLVAVARHGSFSAAAAEIDVSQSALSQAIATLESELGAALFDRSPGGVRLTAAGTALLPHAMDCLDAWTRSQDAISRVVRLEGGELSIACPASLGIDPLPRLVAAFHAAFPDVGIQILDLEERAIGERDLFALGVDVVVTFAGMAAPELHTVQLSPIELFAVLPGDGGTSVPLHDLVSHGLVTTPAGTATHRLMSQALGRETFESAIAVQVVHPEGVLPLVVNGAGAAVLPSGHARIAAAIPGLTRCALDPPASFEVVAAMSATSRSIAAHQFLLVCQEAS